MSLRVPADDQCNERIYAMYKIRFIATGGSETREHERTFNVNENIRTQVISF